MFNSQFNQDKYLEETILKGYTSADIFMIHENSTFYTL